MTFEVSKEAADDLVDIASWTRKNFGEEQAETYLEMLHEVFGKLPGKTAGRVVSRSGREFSYKRVGSHVVYFVGGAPVVIARVLHKRMLPAKHLH